MSTSLLPHAWQQGFHSKAKQHAEGSIAKAIEDQTAKVPSEVFLLAASVSILGALSLKTVGRNQDALFVGQWAAPFLILGLYNKLVKVAGSDRVSA